MTLVPEHWCCSRRYSHPTMTGTVILIAHYGPCGVLARAEIERADPRLLIGGQFLRRLAAGETFATAPGVSVSVPGIGGVFRIDAANGSAVWLLTGFEPVIGGRPVRDVFTAEWPD